MRSALMGGCTEALPPWGWAAGLLYVSDEEALRCTSQIFLRAASLAKLLMC